MIGPGPAAEVDRPRTTLPESRPAPAMNRIIRAIAVEVPWLLLIVGPVAAFSLRNGVPGFRQDWVWPTSSAAMVRWFVDSALSQWNPNGLGGGSQIVSFNVVLAALAAMGAARVAPLVALFILLAAIFTCAMYGIVALLDELDVELGSIGRRALATSYAIGPIAFQKFVAGHVFWLAAYAMLPWFVTYIWRGASGKRCARSFCVAALLYALSTTQIQFAAFDAFVMLVVMAVMCRRPARWLAVPFIIAIGALHNVNALRGPFEPHGAFNLARSHGNLVWERDMSTPFARIIHDAGYIGYDRLALPHWLGVPYGIATVIAGAIGLVGIAVVRDRRTLVFGVVGFAAALFAAGWYGPLAAPLSWLLLHNSLFTVFRELYHVMALYALAAVLLTALALTRVRRFATPIAIALALFVTLPYTSLGASRLVPAIRPDASEEAVAPFEPRLQALLPFQAPLTAPGVESAGYGPSRFVGDDALVGEPPLPLRAAIGEGMTEERRHALLADMGIARISWRENRRSALSTSFEPHVGARFTDFEAQQRRLRESYTEPVALANARNAIVLDDPSAVGFLEAFIADDSVPPGRAVPFESSYVSNNIQTTWVSGSLWSWYDPGAVNVLSEPVFSESSAPLQLALDARAGDIIYVLAAGRAPRLDGRTGTAVPSSRTGEYAWYSWIMSHARPKSSLSGVGFTSVARCIVSDERGWRPARRVVAAEPSENLAYDQSVPWLVRSSLPPVPAPKRLTFARTFDAGWHLRLDGRDLGPPRLDDGMFMGWPVTASRATRSVVLTYEPEVISGVLAILDVVVELGLALFVLWPSTARRVTCA